MKKLEFDQKIFERAWGEGIGVVGVIRRYLELAQEPPKPVIECWINVYPDGFGSTYSSFEDANSSGIDDCVVSCRHLLYNHETGKIEDITRTENDK